MHGFLDLVQRRLITVTDDLSVAFFGRDPPPVPEAQDPASFGQKQRQRQ
jgi:hypothetical protein